METEKSGSVRYFNGICTRFGGVLGVRATIWSMSPVCVPCSWLASRRSDCKIFQFKKVPDIITEVLALRLPDHQEAHQTYRQWDYCVQYQETDMNFVRAPDGARGHLLQLRARSRYAHAGHVRRHGGAPHAANRRASKYYGTDATTVADEEHFNSWLVREEVDSGEYFADDYDFEHPKADLKTKRSRADGAFA